MSDRRRPHVVIIGSGISGLSAAWHLRDHATITILEREDRLGGHTHTHKIELPDRSVKCDSGFIVFNNKTYPNLSDWFRRLKVEIHEAEMSFSVSAKGGKFEWSGANLRSIFTQPERVFDMSFLRMLYDILKFNKRAPADYRASQSQHLSDLSLNDYLRSKRFGKYFTEYYLFPMAGAIWSTPARDIGNISFNAFTEFCVNHGLLQIFDRPQWFSLVGGSNSYIEKLKQTIKERNYPIRWITEIEAQNVSFDGQELSIKSQSKKDSNRHQFQADHVVLACNATQATSILAYSRHPASSELSLLRTYTNKAYLHTDPRLMPRNKRAWAAWNYFSPSNEMNSVSVTYYMNLLQKLDTTHDVFVSLNPSISPDPKTIQKTLSYEHPQLDLQAHRTVARLNDTQGLNNIWFAGAWLGNGFHESGYTSGKTVAEKIINRSSHSDAT